jgi:hypothetical protein
LRSPKPDLILFQIRKTASRPEKTFMEIMQRTPQFGTIFKSIVGKIIFVEPSTHSRKGHTQMNNEKCAPQGTPIYSASITREQFLFYENRTVAKLLLEGKNLEDIVKQVTDENLFQLPTQKSVRSIARACFNRLTFAHNDALVNMIANGSASDAKLALLYAFMCQNLIVRDFMVDVIGEKFRVGLAIFDKSDVARFMFTLGNRVESVSKLSDETVKKVKSVLVKCLAEAGYLTTIRSTDLLQVSPSEELIRIIKERGDGDMLPAFNVF